MNKGGLERETFVFSGGSYSGSIANSRNEPEKTIAQIINENIGHNSEKVHILFISKVKIILIFSIILLLYNLHRANISLQEEQLYLSKKKTCSIPLVPMMVVIKKLSKMEKILIGVRNVHVHLITSNTGIFIRYCYFFAFYKNFSYKNNHFCWDRYIFGVNIADHTDSIWFHCFNDTGVIIIGKDANELNHLKVILFNNNNSKFATIYN